jgi:hypothetical protein
MKLFLLSLLFVCLFIEIVSLCNLGWTQTHNPPASASPVLGLQVCATTANPDFIA